MLTRSSFVQKQFRPVNNSTSGRCCTEKKSNSRVRKVTPPLVGGVVALRTVAKRANYVDSRAKPNDDALWPRQHGNNCSILSIPSHPASVIRPTALIGCPMADHESAFFSSLMSQWPRHPLSKLTWRRRSKTWRTHLMLNTHWNNTHASTITSHSSHSLRGWRIAAGKKYIINLQAKPNEKIHYSQQHAARATQCPYYTFSHSMLTVFEFTPAYYIFFPPALQCSAVHAGSRLAFSSIPG